jgi:hypothetical protein
VLIEGATGASYTITTADAGQKLVYEEEARLDATGVTKSFRSAEVVVPLTDTTLVKAPSFGAGSPAVGTTVTPVIGEYAGATPVAGRRYRNNVLIEGATGASYTISTTDAGQKLVYEEDVQLDATGVTKSFRSAEVVVPISDTTLVKAPSFGAGSPAVGTTVTRVIGEYAGATPHRRPPLP